MAQTVRFATLEKFKANDLRLLVCSDVAARGLDIGGLSHVFNFDVPHHAEDYVHRIGRTGRAGLTGHAFTIAAPTDRFAVEAIEALTGHAIPPIVVEGLDPVDWTEEDGRKRRGRLVAAKGGAKGPARGAATGKPRAKPPPRAEASTAAPSAEAPNTPPRERAGPRSRARPRVAAAAPPPPPLSAVPPPRPAHGRAWRNRAGEADNGAAVRGFGTDVPAFMLLRPRIAPPETRDGDSEA